MAGENDSPADNSVYYEDWAGGEGVTVINTVPPNEVTQLIVADVRATRVTLSWTASTSPTIAAYDIYNGSAPVGTTAATTYTVDGLSPQTAYTFTVRAKSQDGLSSSGVSVMVTTLAQTYALSMNGVNEYILTSPLSFDTVIMDMNASPKAGGYSAYLDASRGIALTTFGRDSSGRDFLQSGWKSVMVDGIDKTSLVGTTTVLPSGQRTVVVLSLVSPGKAPVALFSNQLGAIPMKGLLYSVQFLLNGHVIAYYDFTKPFTGPDVPDRSGNNQTAKLQGGTWVSN
ncbi:fibronectin type III domain-containing protein [Paenibacillus doosanensis]|uniref:Exoglucanase A n=1 Tax=Paenibacillus konkukensis TaxID=2020716 RepID=A0ABY4RUF0_9BACL|nr:MULTISPECIES: fibronectin type III domain-containing protein [Paenibacillus]MCS7461003.1 fibronectin type III domain-containing protein [Paenibacillus doosanensis]UQZ85673.1 Exoglucanase A precursor [Paenibacillus konkukensis]